MTSPAGSWRASAGLAALLAALTLCAFLPVLRNGFVNFDDDAYLGPESLAARGLTAAGVRWAFTTGHMGSWHPLTWLSHMLDVQLFGLDPRGHHAVSLALHAASAVLLFLLLRAATGARWRPLAAAALFAVHPLRVESVAWAAERKDVLAGFCWMLATLAYLRQARRPGPARAAVVAALLALGLLAKPMLVTLPLALLALDLWPLGRIGPGKGPGALRAALVDKLPLLGIATAAAAVAFLVQQGAGAVRSLERFGLALRLENAALSAAGYLGKLLWPSGLAVFYPFPERGVPWWQWGGALAVLLAITGLAVGLRRRAPYLPAGWLWYLATLLPVVGLVQVGGQASADRYTYVPLIGVVVSLVWGSAALLVRAARRPGRARASARTAAALGGIALAVPLVVLAPLTWRQAGFWRDSESLFRRAIAVAPPHWLPYDNLGQALFAQGRLEEAEQVYLHGLRVAPESPELLVDLGITLARRRRVSEALQRFSAAAAADPAFARARYNLGLALGWQGRREEALSELREAVRLEPRSVDMTLALGVALELWVAPGQGAGLIAAAVERDPDAASRRDLVARLLRGR